MRVNILIHLAQYNDNEYHELNSFLKPLYDFDNAMHFVKVRLLNMADNSLIEILDDSHKTLSETVTLDDKIGERFNSLNNTLIEARITSAGREYLKNYYLKFETEKEVLL